RRKGVVEVRRSFHISTHHPSGLRMRTNSARARARSNQCAACAAVTKSTEADPSVVSSAVPATDTSPFRKQCRRRCDWAAIRIRREAGQELRVDIPGDSGRNSRLDQKNEPLATCSLLSCSPLFSLTRSTRPPCTRYNLHFVPGVLCRSLISAESVFSSRSFMKLLSWAVLFLMLIGSTLPAFAQTGRDRDRDRDKDKDKEKNQPSAGPVSGFRDVAAERDVEEKFMAVPDAQLAEEHLRILTQAPHIAGSPEDKATAEYVAKKFREAGLDTEIVEYKVWLNYPAEIRVDMTAPPGVDMHGPT